MGLLAREIEACGVTTVGLALVQELAVAAKGPGEPELSVINQQRTILRELFSLARVAPYPGLVLELPYRWKRQTYPPVVDWTTESEAFTQALARALATEKAPL